MSHDTSFLSWSRYPDKRPRQVIPLTSYDELPDLTHLASPLLACGYRRSYGDSCLNEDGILLDMSPLRRILSFDRVQGVIRCEAGVSLAQILALIVPHGWFIPVTPGTKFVSVGGAIAHDVHGQNQKKVGTFGRFVTQFELLCSSGERMHCSPQQNSALFQATIGGLGLTGVILWAEIRLRPVQGPFIASERIRYSSLSEFMRIDADSEQHYEYASAWIDCFASGRLLGRGVYLRGNHAHCPQPSRKHRSITKALPLAVPFDFPAAALNPLILQAITTGLYYGQPDKAQTILYDPFFYPLDPVRSWNRMYGKRGILEYHCVVPIDSGQEVIQEMLSCISSSKEASFLAVLKTFGDLPSPGLLSFPRAGLTLAVDFPNRGARTIQLFKELDKLRKQCGGALYPAKDAVMTPEDFQLSFPAWKDFLLHKDPAFSSSFWRRVTSEE
ncbi:MAG: FAD-binding oxidoreductase [Ktedonobacteraceae bacterium]|nr:FAD-binding oxidoreductase [Ktedonobacteraceae bacterium]